MKPYQILWFLAICNTYIAHRNHFFNLKQQKKSPGPKVKFRHPSSFAKVFSGPEGFSSTYDKVNLFAKSFSKNSNLGDS